MMQLALSIYDFRFTLAGYGHYKVTYRSPITGKEWIKTINNMPLIDLTKNAAYPKVKDLKDLKRLVKS